jgi:hypothetical protein
MGLGKFLEKKLVGTPEDRARRKQLNQEADTAHWEGYKKGKLEHAKHEGYKKGKSGGGSGIIAGLAGIGNSPTFANPFAPTAPQRRRSHSSGSRSSHGSRGDTIRVNGSTYVKKNTRHHRRRREESDFLF